MRVNVSLALLPIFAENLMLIRCFRFLLRVYCQKDNINTYNFRYCSATNDSSGLRLKKDEVRTCSEVLGTNIYPAHRYSDTLRAFWN